MSTNNKSARKRNIKSAQKGIQSISKKLKQFIKRYESQCRIHRSAIDAHLKDALKKYADESKLLVRFTLQVPESKTDLPMQIRPLIKTIRALWYKAVTDFYFWSLHLPYEELIALAEFLEQPTYTVQYVEFLNCEIDAYSMERFSRCLPVNKFLQSLVLDCTRLNDDGLISLSNGFKSTTHITKLSLCYCNLTVKSGCILGEIIASTTVSELYVDGNSLECDGFVDLIRLVVDQAETDAAQRRREKDTLLKEIAVKEKEASANSRYSVLPTPDMSKSPSARTTTGATKVKSKKRKKKKQKSLKELPKVGPWLHVLHIADNGIDNFTVNSKNVSFEVMRLLKSWIVNCSELREIDLDDNLIGDLGGREILNALQDRQEAGFKRIYMRVTHRMEPEMFKKIITIGSGSSKRGKKKKKGGKGKAGKRRV